jgi:hypothetical protein
MNIPESIALGKKLEAIPTTRPERLLLQDPRVIKRYTELAEKYLETHDFVNKLACLQNKMSANFETEDVHSTI